MNTMTGRPQSTEAAPYYHTYIDKVPGDDAVQVMESQLDECSALFSAISEDKSLYKYALGKWSIREVLSHINDTERMFAFRALWFARGFALPLPSFDQNIAIAGAQADSVPWSEHVEEFRRLRPASISFFRNLPPEAWDRSGIASDNRFTVRALAFITAGHYEHHARLIREKYL